MDRKVWSGPVGIARIIAILAAIWTIIVSAASLMGVAGYSPAKAAVPVAVMLAALAFMAVYQMVQSKH
jgi:hypothetical protein